MQHRQHRPPQFTPMRPTQRAFPSSFAPTLASSSPARPLQAPIPANFLPNRPFIKPPMPVDSTTTHASVAKWFSWAKSSVWDVLRAERHARQPPPDWTQTEPSGVEPIDEVDRFARERADAELVASQPKRVHSAKKRVEEEPEVNLEESTRTRRRSAIDAEDAIREEGRSEKHAPRTVSALALFVL